MFFNAFISIIYIISVFNKNLFFLIQSFELLIISMDHQEFVVNLDYVLLFFFFYNVIESNHFLYHFIILLHLISSFSFTRSMFVPYAYVSIESIGCITLSPFGFNIILLISSVKKLCLSLLNLCCVFNIDFVIPISSFCIVLTVLNR